MSVCVAIQLGPDLTPSNLLVVVCLSPSATLPASVGLKHSPRLSNEAALCSSRPWSRESTNCLPRNTSDVTAPAKRAEVCSSIVEPNAGCSIFKSPVAAAARLGWLPANTRQPTATLRTTALVAACTHTLHKCRVTPPQQAT